MTKEFPTLDEYNKLREELIKKSYVSFAQVVCPSCGDKMFYLNPDQILTSFPPKKEVYCDCGYTGYKFV